MSTFVGAVSVEEDSEGEDNGGTCYPACRWYAGDSPDVNLEPFKEESPYGVVDEVEEEDIAVKEF